MGRYYLHLKDFKGELLIDEDGAEFQSLAAAREEALLTMRDFTAAAIKQGDEPSLEAIILADEHGTHLAAVPLTAALSATIVGLLKHPEKVIPPDRFEELRRHADDCRHKAENALDLDDKMSWLKLADAWLQMLPSSHLPSDGSAGWPKASDADSQETH